MKTEDTQQPKHTSEYWLAVHAISNRMYKTNYNYLGNDICKINVMETFVSELSSGAPELKAEVKRLRKALKNISEVDDDSSDYSLVIIRDLCESALNETPKQP